MWKSIGGMTHLTRANNINTNTLTAENIYLRNAYAGDFSIAGNLHVDNNADIAGNLKVDGNTILQHVYASYLDVSHNSNFNGDVAIHANLTLDRGTATIRELTTTYSATVGTELYMKGNSTTPSMHYFYGSDNGIGLDTHTPTATFDIQSTEICGLNVATDQSTNRNVLANNAANNGVIVSATPTTASVDFYTATAVDISNNPDSSISCVDGGIMSITNAGKLQVMSNMSIAGSTHTETAQVCGEALTVYDNATSGNAYLGDIYQSTNCLFGKSANMVANTNSVSFIHFTDANCVGGAIGGGIYPGQPNGRILSLGLTDNSGNYMPTETVVSASAGASKYMSTTGFNTCMPHNDQYVLDVNGPMRIDNGDIVQTLTNDFEITQMVESTNAPTHVMAIGASIDLSGEYVYGGRTRYRYNILYSNNGGGAWNSTTVLPNGASSANSILAGNNLYNIDAYDASIAFITGDKNTLAYTNNGGVSWKGLGTFANVVSFGAIKIKDAPSMPGYLRVYTAIDGSGVALDSNGYPIIPPTSSYFGYFDISKNVLMTSTSTLFVNMRIYPTTVAKISSISLSSSRVYLAGDAGLATYLESNLSVADNTYSKMLAANPGDVLPPFPYIWVRIDAYDDNYAVAVGTVKMSVGYPDYDQYEANLGIISTTHDGGQTWSDYNSFSDYSYPDPDGYYAEYYGTALPYECIVRDVRIIDSTHTIVVGYMNERGLVMVSADSGVTWHEIDRSLVSSAGRQNMLLGTSRRLTNVNIIDTQTFLIARTIDFADIAHTRNGSAYVYSAFVPNYLNSSTNNVLDICGNMTIFGNIQMRTFGNTISSDSASFNLANSASTVNIGKLTSVVGTVNMGNVNCVSLTQTSDYRIKQFAVELDDTAVVDNLRPIIYTNQLSGKQEMGFLAHEVQAEYPFMVDGIKDGPEYQGLRYNNLIALLVKEVQVLKQQVRDLQNKI